MKLISTLAVLCVLSACATTEEPAAPRQASPSPEAAKYDAQKMTGSRIPARRTEKMVSATTGKDYEQELNTKRVPLLVN